MELVIYCASQRYLLGFVADAVTALLTSLALSCILARLLLLAPMSCVCRHSLATRTHSAFHCSWLGVPGSKQALTPASSTFGEDSLEVYGLHLPERFPAGPSPNCYSCNLYHHFTLISFLPSTISLPYAPTDVSRDHLQRKTVSPLATRLTLNA